MHKAGHIPISDLKTYFNPRLHPEVVAGRKSCDELRFIVLNSLELSQPATKCHQQAISFAVSFVMKHKASLHWYIRSWKYRLVDFRVSRFERYQKAIIGPQMSLRKYT